MDIRAMNILVVKRKLFHWRKSISDGCSYLIFKIHNENQLTIAALTTAVESHAIYLLSLPLPVFFLFILYSPCEQMQQGVEKERI